MPGCEGNACRDVHDLMVLDPMDGRMLKSLKKCAYGREVCLSAFSAFVKQLLGGPTICVHFACMHAVHTCIHVGTV
jgi:hypothetical protein